MYTPDVQLLDNYADILVNFALNDGFGIKKGDVVVIVSQIPGTPLAKSIYRAVLKSGGQPLVQLQDDDFKVLQLNEGSDEQISFFPKSITGGLPTIWIITCGYSPKRIRFFSQSAIRAK